MGKFIKKFNENYDENSSSTRRELENAIKNKSEERKKYESDKLAFGFIIKKGEKFPENGEMIYISDITNPYNDTISHLMLISSFGPDLEFTYKWIPKSLIDVDQINDEKYQIRDNDTELINFFKNN